jgi:murein DD-endopeptidase MepM/ murein hydrolase activator NlpD
MRSNLGSLSHDRGDIKRHIRKHWIAAAAVLPLFVGMAAFGIAPGTVPDDIPTRTVIAKLDPALGTPLTPQDLTFHRDEVIRLGDTIFSVSQRLGINESDIRELISITKLPPLRTGEIIEADINAEGTLLGIKLDRSGAPPLTVVREKGSLAIHEQAVQEHTLVVMRSGTIRSSLFGALDAASIPDEIADKMAEVFGTKLDFRNDLRAGDTFGLVYEMKYRNGEPAGTGRILAAEYVNSGKAYRAVLYRMPDGQENYFTPEGEPMREGFLRSPLEFTRVTSGFSSSRRHPVLGYNRAHTGVDFGAPTGTRVKAVSDARVVFSGRRGGYGNLVILRHHNGYETYYAHLSRFADGIRPGKSVSQGQVIAFVGATGTATGPHLHYEVRIGGRPNNPLTVKLPGGAPLPGNLKTAFKTASQPWVERIELLRGTNLAALD